MKYDSGMTHFKNDIIAAIKRLLTGDEEITKKFRAEDDSPTPLREYLKERYGKSRQGYSGDGVRYDCASIGLSIKFDTILNNPGDKELTLSWSQVAKFIRDNWDEIFDKAKPRTRALETLVKTFDESEITCPNWIKGQTLKYLELVNGVHFECKKYTAEFCELKVITKFLASRCHCPENCPYCKDEQKSDFPCDNCSHDVQGCCDYPDTADDYCVQGDKQVPVHSSADNSLAKFDYSALDAGTAKGLRDCEDFIRRKTSGYFTELGQKFKEAQTLLASHSAGTFEKWYTSVGFKRQTVYNLIDRYEFLSSPTIGGREEIFEALPLTLSYEISKPDAPAELVDKVLDGDIESNAEYQKLKAELEKANKKAEFWSNAQQNALKENQKLRGDRNKAMTKVTNLERKLKELENRPVDVAVQQDDKLLEEIERLKSENEQLKNSEPEPIDDGTKTFLMRITMDDLGRLAELTEKDPLLHSKVMHAQIIRL